MPQTRAQWGRLINDTKALACKSLPNFSQLPHEIRRRIWALFYLEQRFIHATWRYMRANTRPRAGNRSPYRYYLRWFFIAADNSNAWYYQDIDNKINRESRSVAQDVRPLLHRHQGIYWCDHSTVTFSSAEPYEDLHLKGDPMNGVRVSWEMDHICLQGLDATHREFLFESPAPTPALQFLGWFSNIQHLVIQPERNTFCAKIRLTETNIFLWTHRNAFSNLKTLRLAKPLIPETESGGEAVHFQSRFLLREASDVPEGWSSLQIQQGSTRMSSPTKDLPTPKNWASYAAYARRLGDGGADYDGNKDVHGELTGLLRKDEAAGASVYFKLLPLDLLDPAHLGFFT